MNKFFTVSILVAMLFSVAVVVSGVGPDVDYLEGTLEYRQGRNKWLEVSIGETVPEGRTIRLSDQGFAELSMNGNSVTLTKDGVYETAKLFKRSANASRRNFRQVLGSKFSFLLNRDSSEDGMTVAAVRGAAVEGDGAISWVDESTNYLKDGIVAYKNGDFHAAKALFHEGSIWETGAEQRESTFRYALSLQALADPRGARRALAGLKPEPQDSYIGEYTIAMGTLYLESMEYDKVDEVLTTYLDKYPKGEAAQAAWLLSFYSLNGQGRSRMSQTSLNKAVDLGANTEIGQVAASMMN